MTKLTLGQAAKDANKAKATILDAIKNGRLSAQKGDKGQYEIDPAELFRVYPKTEQKPNGKTETEHLETNHKTALLLQKIDFLERRLGDIEGERDNLRSERDRERKQLQETIDNLRNDHDRLLSVITEQAGTVKQLTYQPKTEPSQATIAWQWWLILALVISSAGVWFWWVGH
jgi:hypothetical protein